MPKSRGGRPALPPAKRLSARVTVNLTPAEHRALRRLLAPGESAADYVRQVLLRHLAAKGPKA